MKKLARAKDLPRFVNVPYAARIAEKEGFVDFAKVLGARYPIMKKKTFATLLEKDVQPEMQEKARLAFVKAGILPPDAIGGENCEARAEQKQPSLIAETLKWHAAAPKRLYAEMKGALAKFREAYRERNIDLRDAGTLRAVLEARLVVAVGISEAAAYLGEPVISAVAQIISHSSTVGMIAAFVGNYGMAVAGFLLAYALLNAKQYAKEGKKFLAADLAKFLKIGLMASALLYLVEFSASLGILKEAERLAGRQLPAFVVAGFVGSIASTILFMLGAADAGLSLTRSIADRWIGKGID